MAKRTPPPPLGGAPGPITDQMDAATARVNKLLAGMRRKGFATYQIGREATPRKIHELAYAVGEAMGRPAQRGQGIGRGCNHVSHSIQLNFLFACEWNLARCETCATERGRELARVAQQDDEIIPCDLCDAWQVPPHPFAFGLGFYLVRGWACDECLTAPLLGTATRTPQLN